MLFLVSVTLFVVTPLIVVPALLVLILFECLVDSCFQTVSRTVSPTNVSNDPWWLISVVQSAISILLRTWLILVHFSGSFLLSTCSVCCFQASWFVVKNGWPQIHNSFRLSCVAEHPLEARSAVLSSDDTCAHCSGFVSSWVRAIQFSTNVWYDCVYLWKNYCRVRPILHVIDFCP